jgi:hypothetical protein
MEAKMTFLTQSKIDSAVVGMIVLIMWIFALSLIGLIGCWAGDMIDGWLEKRERTLIRK